MLGHNWQHLMAVAWLACDCHRRLVTRTAVIRPVAGDDPFHAHAPLKPVAMPSIAPATTQQDSSDPASLWLQAMQAYDSGDRARSRHLGTRLLGLEPESPRVHWLLASIGLDEGDMHAAVEHVQVAARQAPTVLPNQLVAITRLMIAVGEFEPAWHLLETAHRSAPSGNLLVAIGEQLLMLERYPDALACLLAAEKMGGKHPMLSFLLSSAYRFLGDLPRAITAAEDTLRLQPDFAHAHWALSQLGPREGAGRRVDGIRRSIGSLEQRRDTASLQIQSGLAMLWHALFRELDALDDRPGAWLALSNGLAVKKRLQPHDRDAEDRLFRQLCEIYTSDFIQQQEAPFASDTTPIFIVGMPRTGTTLVERVITNHEHVAGCGELNELQLLVKRRIGRWSPEFLDATAAARLGAPELRGIGEAYLKAVAWRLGGKPYMVDKHQSNFLLAGIIARHIPHARIIHVRRDPADACFSNLKEPFAPHVYSYSNDQRDVANHYRNYDRLMRQLQHAAGDRILEVRYEDLVLDRQGQTARILDFTGLPEQPGLDDISANNRPVASASSVQVREPIHDRNIGAWRRYSTQLSVLTDSLHDQS